LIRTTSKAPGAGAVEGSGSWDTIRVFVALLIVLAAIYLCKWLMRRIMGLPSASSSEQLVKVLSRTNISPKQSVVVLQVGQRVLVVADSGQQMSTLCEITDAEEIRAFTGGPVPAKAPFESVLRREMSRQDGDEDSDAPAASEPQAEAITGGGLSPTRREVHSLLEKVRGLSQQFK
jgi:flagellar biosynthetic protein FliO